MALASAGAIAFAIAQYQTSLTHQRDWPQPRIEFQWVPELRTSIDSSGGSYVLPASRTARASSQLREMSHGLRRLLPPALPRNHASPPQRYVQNSIGTRRAEGRVKDALARELYDNFKLFLYVSKAENGPLAQHMYVFDKTRHGGLRLLHDWPVSTGRETTEADYSGADVSTQTPSGYYELDPRRFYKHHVSAEWHEPMPYAMFLNWVRDGARTGLAIHAASGSDIAELGTRASAGCIRLAPEDARALFDLIRTRYRGHVPQFAIDPRTGTMSTNGMVVRNAHGRVKFVAGYKVLLMIENYGGDGNVVTAMF